MKRFYKVVTTQAEQDGFSILLDGKPVHTPAKSVLRAPNEKIAEAIMQEWAGQVEKVKPDSMPLTQILTTKIDRVRRERPAMVATVLKYMNTDLLCYRTDDPPEVASLQVESWDPWLAWFEKTFGGALKTTTDLQALAQEDDLYDRVEAYIKALDDDYFTVFQLVVSLSGSLVLGLAFMAQEITPEQVFQAARVEERYKARIYNEEKYGPDPVEEQKDRAIQADLSAAQVYLQLLT